MPTQLWRILDLPDLDRYDTSSVRNVGRRQRGVAAGAAAHAAGAHPHRAGGTALGYGSTETVGLGTTLRPGAELAHTESIGLPSATMQVQVRDSETDKVLPEGEVGEICLRGGSVFLGYWRNPEATARALDDDRWYRTGDVGVIRDGYVHLEGRRNDLIIRGGENISPVEIENRLFEHPEIAEVAIVGVDHPKLGPGGRRVRGAAHTGRAHRGRGAGMGGGDARGVQGAEQGRVPRRAPAQRERQGAQAPAPVAGEGE